MSDGSYKCICGKICLDQAGLEACLRFHLTKVSGTAGTPFAPAGCRNDHWSECWCSRGGFMHNLPENALELSRHMLEQPEGLLAHYLAHQLEAR